MFWVYVIKGRNGRYYTGYTSDLERRLKDHNRGKSYSLKGKGPFEIVSTEKYPTKIEAIRRERQIKKLKGGIAFKRFLNKVKNMSPSSSLV